MCHARHRNAAHGRPHVPAQADGAPSAAGHHHELAGAEGLPASMEALRSGAVEVIPKPGGPYSVGEVTERLINRIRALRGVPIKFTKPAPVAAQTPIDTASSVTLSGRRLNGLIAIGASTGGTQAIEAILTRLPADVPPIVIVQHMPAGFTKVFADDSTASARCASSKPPARNAGARHRLRRARQLPHGRRALRHPVEDAAESGPARPHQRPSVDVLFHSIARFVGVPTVGLLLTGMGADGADGMVALRQSGRRDDRRRRAFVCRVRHAERSDHERRGGARCDAVGHAVPGIPVLRRVVEA